MIVASFDSAERLVAAARAARERGFGIVDAFTPHPVHGLDAAMGLRRTRLAQVGFCFAMTGLLSALAFQLWTHAVDWPMNVGGKSFPATPATGPIIFEFTVLLCGVGTTLVLLARAKLWPGKKPFLPADRITDDRYVLAVEGDARALMEELGAVEIKEVSP